MTVTVHLFLGVPCYHLQRVACQQMRLEGVKAATEVCKELVLEAVLAHNVRRVLLHKRVAGFGEPLDARAARP